MDLENYKCPNLASMEDGEETENISTLEKLENVGASEVDTNGSEIEYNHSVNDLFLDSKGNKEPEASISVTTRKGYGLKKWRRIKRDSIKSGGESSDSTAKMAVHELSNLVTNPSKRTQVYVERQQLKNEGSVSSPKPLVVNFSDTFALYDDYKNTMRSSLSEKNSTRSVVQRGQQGKGRDEATKNVSEDRIKIDEENSQSSLESDSRSSNFVFMQRTYETRRTKSEGRESNHEVRGSEWRFSEGLEGGDFNETLENNGSSLDQDSLVESILVLQKAQQALEEEVLKLKEIGKDASVDGFLSSSEPNFTEVGIKSFEQFPSGESVVKFSRTSESEVFKITKRDMEAQLDVRKLDIDQHVILEEQNSSAPTLAGTDYCKDIIVKLQRRVCKYTSCFLVQLLASLIVVGVFIVRLSPDHVEVVPT